MINYECIFTKRLARRARQINATHETTITAIALPESVSSTS